MSAQIRLAGVDLAWQSDRNPTAIAIGALGSAGLHVETVFPQLDGLPRIADTLERVDGLTGVAIDAPLIINNATGQRSCEQAIGVTYGARKAACHPANTRLYPDAGSVALSATLLDRGFTHLTGAKWQIECYPHPALIEIFGLEQRLRYKKGRVAEKRAGQIALGRLIKQLSASPVLKLHGRDTVALYSDAQRIAALRGQQLKNNENALDAIVCLYIAALHAIGAQGRCFGDVQSGYIWVPQCACV